MQNIFVFGLAGTGKDTFAWLMEKHYDTQSIALADSIRQEYMQFVGRDDYKRNRPMMIKIGEGYKSIYGQDVWCKQAENHFGWSDGRLIKDGRYEHEYHYFVIDRGYIPIRLVADADVRYERLKRRDGNIQREALEFEKQNFIPDGYKAIDISTNGTVEELEKTVRGLFK
jgi:hypothetical protein